MGNDILNISACDTVYVSKSYQLQTPIEAVGISFVCNMPTFSYALENLFSNINTFSRPPTSILSNSLAIKNHTANMLCDSYYFINKHYLTNNLSYGIS